MAILASLNRVGVHSSKAKNARLFLSIVGMKQRIPSTAVWFDVKSRWAKQSFKVFSMIETGISPPVEACSLSEISPAIEMNTERNTEVVQITAQSPFDRRWEMAIIAFDTASAGPSDHRMRVYCLDSGLASSEFERLQREIHRAARR